MKANMIIKKIFFFQKSMFPTMFPMETQKVPN
uniref:Uncharacterized protein n=1 Tax=viral metagenome TaxID=1070528 RepID=A0A6C0CR83_9ZZZZ